MRKIIFNSSLILLSVLILDHLCVMLSFIITSRLLPFAFPLSVIIAVTLFLFLDKEKEKKKISATILLSLFVIFISIAFSIFYYDLSWDGQWYHQSAIYHLNEGWNPLFEPIRTFEENNDLSIIHFPKHSWYYAVSVLSTLHNIEAGKSMNFILLFASIFLVYNTAREYKLRSFISWVIAILVCLNPVVWSEITTFLVDGILFLYLTIYITMLFAWFREPDNKYVLIGAMAIIGAINLKFTGIVFFCVFALFALVYVLLYKRDCIVKFIAAHSVVLFVSVLLFGYNPYVTNFIKRNHPLYPIMGTEKFPSIFVLTGEDANEKYETPLNMVGKNLFVRIFYSTFGRPDNAPYFKEKEAKVIWPFTSKIEDWKAYYFHETRVSGFGPFYSGILIMATLLLIVYIRRNKLNPWAILLSLASIICTLLFSKHFWWPRFAPQAWLIPIVILCFSFFHSMSKNIRYCIWTITLLLLINGGIVFAEHMGWETRSSMNLHKQLTELQERRKPIEISYGWFKKSMEEKLNKRQIEYASISEEKIKKGIYKKMTSVVEGYPNMVLYREKEDKMAHHK